MLQGDRVGDLAALDQLGRSGVDPAVHGIAEMLGQEKFGNPAVGRVVDQDRPEQGLLGLGVGGRLRHPFQVGFAE